jgi:hypothetical protein
MWFLRSSRQPRDVNLPDKVGLLAQWVFSRHQSAAIHSTRPITVLIDLLVNGLDDLLLTVSKTVFVLVCTSLIAIGFGESAQLVSHDLLFVASRPRFGCYSQARTRQLVWTSWRETQLGRNQLERHSWTGTSYIVRNRHSTDRVFLCL